MSRVAQLLGGSVAAILATFFVLIMAFFATISSALSDSEDEEHAAYAGWGACADTDLEPSSDGKVPAASGGQQTANWSGEQRKNAATITGVGKARGLPPRAAQIAVATAIQESTLRNIDYGDRDSVGLFQQRPSQGWGTVKQIMDPVYSAGKFYDGLVKVKGWKGMPLTKAAQTVQRSGFPDAYAKWETASKDLVEAVWKDVELPAGADADGTGNVSEECLEQEQPDDDVVEGGSGWVAPVGNTPVSTKYRASGASWSSGYHTGIDFAVPAGTSVRAAGPGTVVTAGWSKSYGYQVVIKHKDGMYSQYAHLSSLSAATGDQVRGGSRLGLSGSTGNSNGPHLHFEIRTGPEYGSDVDPVTYLRDRGVSL